MSVSLRGWELLPLAAAFAWAFGAAGAAAAPGAAGTGQPAPVLVELFTSEGCSSCPPADALLREIDGKRTAGGQLVIALSEHVSYWDGLGWKDRFSSQLYTDRQNAYGERLGLDGVYTPQMIVNGREQLVGSDRRALSAAFAAEAGQRQVALHITGALLAGQSIRFTYEAAGLPAGSPLELFAVVTDDADQSGVERGENAGRRLVHVSVARVLVPLGAPHAAGEQRIALPAALALRPGSGHHLVVFAQERHAGAVAGVDAFPI